MLNGLKKEHTGSCKMNPNNQISGKVSNVLNLRQVAINIGMNHGVTQGMIFDVYNPSPIKIIDPDSRETLGIIDDPKIRLKVEKAYDKFSVLTTFRTRVYRTGNPGLGIGAIANYFLPSEKIEVENLKKRDIDERLDEEESLIKPGDVVRAVILQEVEPKLPQNS
jgi:hypothetical protein